MSLIGSIYSNLLLVLGCAFVLGGANSRNPKTQRFNQDAAVANSALLLLAMLALLLPGVLDATHQEAHGLEGTLDLSRFVSVLLLLVYMALIYYQLISHQVRVLSHLLFVAVII